MQTIFIKNLEIYGYHGVYEREKISGQRFLVNVKADIDTAGRITDDLKETLDYGKLCEFIKKYFVEVNKNLLENLVEELEEKLLATYREIRKIEIEIGKPDVIVPFELENIGIRASKQWHKVYLGLGSNMGDRNSNMEMALNQLKASSAFSEIRVSQFIETKPYGYTDQADFLNAVVEAETYLEPYELLNFCHKIEAAASRVREIHWGPRTLDLDILLYEDLIMSEPDLCIPHVDMHNRSFVLDPICELNPYAYHPILGKRMIELKKDLEGRSQI